jgi:hypothetical protein
VRQKTTSVSSQLTSSSLITLGLIQGNTLAAEARTRLWLISACLRELRGPVRSVSTEGYRRDQRAVSTAREELREASDHHNIHPAQPDRHGSARIVTRAHHFRHFLGNDVRCLVPVRRK